MHSNTIVILIISSAFVRSWGTCDVEDACSGAKHLADTGKVDGRMLCIDGGSAGGYTTLACLAFAKVFSAGRLHRNIIILPISKKNCSSFAFSNFACMTFGTWDSNYDSNYDKVCYIL